MLMLPLSACTPPLFPNTDAPRFSLQTTPFQRRRHRPQVLSSDRHPSSSSSTTKTSQDGILASDVKTLVKFKSRHNLIRVLQVSRATDHPLAGSRLLLLDSPGNIHSISFPFRFNNPLTSTYFDVFATLPPILPPGPVAVLGFGAGSAARLLLELYPNVVVHGWELDAAVIDVAREFFGLSDLERVYKDRLFVHIGDALKASSRDAFAGILVDLFSQGCLVPELQDASTWAKLRRCLRKCGRVVVNVGGSCVEAEDKSKDGRVVMEETLEAMRDVFGKKEVLVLKLGNGDSSLALTGRMPEREAWKMGLTKPLRAYVDMWGTS